MMYLANSSTLSGFDMLNIGLFGLRQNKSTGSKIQSYFEYWLLRNLRQNPPVESISSSGWFPVPVGTNEVRWKSGLYPPRLHAVFSAVVEWYRHRLYFQCFRRSSVQIFYLKSNHPPPRNSALFFLDKRKRYFWSWASLLKLELPDLCLASSLSIFIFSISRKISTRSLSSLYSLFFKSWFFS